MEIQVKGDTSFTTNIDSITCTPGTSVVVTLTGLDPSTQYVVRGAAKVGSGPIGYSDTVSFTTLSAQATAESYEGNWANDVAPTTGQFSRVVISVTNNVATVHIYFRTASGDTDQGSGTATIANDQLAFTLLDHMYVISFTDASRTHLKVVISSNNIAIPPQGTFTFHRQFKLFPGAPGTVVTAPVSLKP